MVEADGGLTLALAAQALVADLPCKADAAERLFRIRERLVAHPSPGDHPRRPGGRTAGCRRRRPPGRRPGQGQNLLLPKPRPEGDQKRPGQRQRKPLPARRRRTDIPSLSN